VNWGENGEGKQTSGQLDVPFVHAALEGCVEVQLN
jgi:hypothetical protein